MENEKYDVHAGYSDCCFSVNDKWFRLRTGATIIEDNSLLLVKSTTSKYFYSGGGIEEGESPEEAAIRELKEEAGVDGEIIRPMLRDLAWKSFEELSRVDQDYMMSYDFMQV